MSTTSSQKIAIELAGAGYELLTSDDGREPLVRDLELARWLGFGTDYKVRDLIGRWVPELGEVLTMAVKTSDRGGRPGREYHLTEEQALFIAAKSETPRATQILKAMIAVFMEARRRLGLGAADSARKALTCLGHGCTGDQHGKGCPSAAKAPARSFAAPKASRLHLPSMAERELSADRGEDIADHVLAPVPPAKELPLKSVRSGTIELGGFGFSCAILNDGRAVLSLHDFYAAFGLRPHKGHGFGPGDLRSRLPAVLCRPGVAAFVSWRLPKLLAPIVYQRYSADPGDVPIEGVDPSAVTEVCATIMRAVAACKVHPTSTKAVGSAVKVLSATALCPWSVRIEQACGGTTALAKPAAASLAPTRAGGEAGGALAMADAYEAIADAVVQRMQARRVPTPVTSRMSEPDAHELRTRLANIEHMLLEQAARGGDL